MKQLESYLFFEAYYNSVLGHKLYAITLVTILLSSVVAPTAFAAKHYSMESRASININTASTSYNPADRVLVEISVQPVTENQITISIFDPEKLFATESLLPDVTGEATHAFALPEDAIAGEWRVTATYMEAEAETTFSVTQLEVEPTPAPEPVPVSINLSTDKLSYTIGETVLINVHVEPVSTEVTSVIISILDPNDNVLVKVELEPETETSYAWSIVDGYPNGTFTVIASYGDALAKVEFTVEEAAVTPPVPESILETGWVATDKQDYSPGEVVILKGKTEPGAKATIVVFTPLKDVLLEEDIDADENGDFRFGFKLPGDAESGEWLVGVFIAGDHLEATFSVEESIAGLPVELPQPKVKAVIKNVKRLTLLSINNIGKDDLSSIAIHFGDGIRFVKARGWDRERVDMDTVLLTPAKDGLQPGDHLITLMVLKEKPLLCEGLTISPDSDPGPGCEAELGRAVVYAGDILSPDPVTTPREGDAWIYGTPSPSPADIFVDIPPVMFPTPSYPDLARITIQNDLNIHRQLVDRLIERGDQIEEPLVLSSTTLGHVTTHEITAIEVDLKKKGDKGAFVEGKLQCKTCEVSENHDFSILQSMDFKKMSFGGPATSYDFSDGGGIEVPGSLRFDGGLVRHWAGGDSGWSNLVSEYTFGFDVESTARELWDGYTTESIVDKIRPPPPSWLDLIEVCDRDCNPGDIYIIDGESYYVPDGEIGNASIVAELSSIATQRERDGQLVREYSEVGDIMMGVTLEYDCETRSWYLVFVVHYAHQTMSDGKVSEDSAVFVDRKKVDNPYPSWDDIPYFTWD